MLWRRLVAWWTGVELVSFGSRAELESAVMSWMDGLLGWDGSVSFEGDDLIVEGDGDTLRVADMMSGWLETTVLGGPVEERWSGHSCGYGDVVVVRGAGRGLG